MGQDQLLENNSTFCGGDFGCHNDRVSLLAFPVLKSKSTVTCPVSYGRAFVLLKNLFVSNPSLNLTPFYTHKHKLLSYTLDVRYNCKLREDYILFTTLLIWGNLPFWKITSPTVT